MKQIAMAVTIGTRSDRIDRMLADEWWFWVAAGLVLASAAVLSGRYRSWAAELRRRALERRIVDPGQGRRIETAPAGFWGDLGWLLILTGVWVGLSPWIWGYDGEPGAITTDVTAGAAIVVLSTAGILFPSLLTLNVLAGTWLMIAPWLVGYGSHDGPVGLSDVIAGLVVMVASLMTLADASRRTRPAEPQAVARIRPPG
jgi:hypothetical protein